MPSSTLTKTTVTVMTGQTSSKLADWFTWSVSGNLSAIVVTLLIALILPVLIHSYLYRQAVSREAPSILLVGPSGSGKTSLFTLFATSTTPTTHTSQSPHTTTCQLPSHIRSSSSQFRSENDSSDRPTFTLTDTPGHGKLRHHAFTLLTATPQPKNIIFTVDSAALSSPSGLTEAAEYLHDVLLLLQKRANSRKGSKGPEEVRVLVAANKQDVFTSLPEGVVRKKLEEEIARVRGGRSSGMVKAGGEEGEEDEEGNWLGEFGKEGFGFGELEESGILVRVVGGNVREGDGEEQVEGWWEWVGEGL
ncbi:unnamed protein product [Zymoseptoria tritici ST99CH_3D1]|nr:unnamed protein product [Zymoseptoria tritici ST99CH_3D1]